MKIERMKNLIGTALAYGIATSAAIISAQAVDADLGDPNALGDRRATRSISRGISIRRGHPYTGERSIWDEPSEGGGGFWGEPTVTRSKGSRRAARRGALLSAKGSAPAKRTRGHDAPITARSRRATGGRDYSSSPTQTTLTTTAAPTRTTEAIQDAPRRGTEMSPAPALKRIRRSHRIATPVTNWSGAPLPDPVAGVAAHDRIASRGVSSGNRVTVAHGRIISSPSSTSKLKAAAPSITPPRSAISASRASKKVAPPAIYAPPKLRMLQVPATSAPTASTSVPSQSVPFTPVAASTMAPSTDAPKKPRTARKARSSKKVKAAPASVPTLTPAAATPRSTNDNYSFYDPETGFSSGRYADPESGSIAVHYNNPETGESRHSLTNPKTGYISESITNAKTGLSRSSTTDPAEGYKIDTVADPNTGITTAHTTNLKTGEVNTRYYSTASLAGRALGGATAVIASTAATSRPATSDSSGATAVTSAP